MIDTIVEGMMKTVVFMSTLIVLLLLCACFVYLLCHGYQYLVWVIA